MVKDVKLQAKRSVHVTGKVQFPVKIGEEGLPNPNICMSKVNQYVQFKVKEIKDKL